ncbi:MAG: VIT family protein [Patescibacteria group bacterium]
MKKTRNPITHIETDDKFTGTKLNWLRAAVLGANDGIVSVASVIVGVAGASVSKGYIMTAGVAALVAGALSMAMGEYVSVSTQRDTEKALLEKERMELETMPEEELEELVQLYENKGLERNTAELVAKELTAKDAFRAHVDAELHIDPNDLTDPFHAAYASGLAFLSGAIIPIIAVLLAPLSYVVGVTFISVIIALIITGMLSANAGGASKGKATLRVVFGGLIAMIITFGVGKIFGVAGI